MIDFTQKKQILYYKLMVSMMKYFVEDEKSEYMYAGNNELASLTLDIKTSYMNTPY